MTGEGGIPALIVRGRSQICALRLTDVIEIMRPLALQPLRAMPSFVLGLSVIRGLPVPVVALDSLLSEAAGAPTPIGRFVSLRAGERRLALAVGAVVGVVDLERSRLSEMPPLLGQSDAELVDQLGLLDSQLLVVLSAARAMPEGSWQDIAAQQLAAP
jgi:purine-binding chemotaxis protein CheW